MFYKMNVNYMLNEQEIKEMLNRMSEEDIIKLIQMCNNKNNENNINKALLKLQNNYKCPHCHSNKINKNGTAHKNLPQFICRNCKKTYTIRTNTIFYYSKKDISVWQEYIMWYKQGLSLRQIVKKMDGKIKLQTAFYWRHKIIEVMKNFDNHDKLEGIVEADETYFEESQKGSRHMTRKARKRGYTSYSYTKKTKICVLTAIDGNKSSFTKPVGFGGLEKNDVVLLQRHLVKDSVLITDGNMTYRNLHDIKLKSLKFGKPENKVYHLNNINNFHSLLKKFMIRFNGVATKYLDYYVEYFKNIKDNIDIFTALLNNAIYCRNIDIRNKRVCFEVMKF